MNIFLVAGLISDQHDAGGSGSCAENGLCGVFVTALAAVGESSCLLPL
ncbi:hypothetical protein ACFC1L_26945 [Streptomyces sp. NPDC056210]